MDGLGNYSNISQVELKQALVLDRCHIGWRHDIFNLFRGQQLAAVLNFDHHVTEIVFIAVRDTMLSECLEDDTVAGSNVDADSNLSLFICPLDSVTD